MPPSRKFSWLCEFFTAKDTPLNLALFRIIMMTTFLFALDRATMIWCSALPKSLLTPISGAKYVFALVPLNESTATVAVTLAQIGCIFGALGLCTNVSIAVAAVCGAYALLIPDCVSVYASHRNHLFWFAAILAVSPCGDMLSIDALFSAWRRAKTERVCPVERSQAYALPLRFVWLLLAIILFFPGLGKLLQGGSGWLLGDGVLTSFIFKWTELGDWTPPFKIEQYPLLYRTGAVAVMIAEMSFGFLMLMPSTRMIAACVALLFHNLTSFIMRISFWQLQPAYLSLFDWPSLFKRAGNWLFKIRLKVLYEPDCIMCRRIIAMTQTIDVFQQIDFVTGAIALNLHSLKGGAAMQLCRRVPLLLFLLPVLWLDHKTEPSAADEKIQVFSKKSEFDENESAGQFHTHRQHSHSSHPANLVTISLVGGILVGGNLFAGVIERVPWPFLRYPVYVVGKDTTTALALALKYANGEEVFIDLNSEWPFLTRYKNRLWRFAWPGMADNRTDLLDATWELILKEHPEYRKAESVRFYRESWSLKRPDYATRKPSYTLLRELAIPHDSASH